MSVLKIVFVLIAICVLFSLNSIPYSYGHGLGYEILPSVMLGNREVALEVKTTPSTDSTIMENQITFSLFEPKTNNQVKEVTYKIKASKSNDFLFEKTFQTNDGILVMDFRHSESNNLSVQEKPRNTNFFDSLFSGLKQDVILVEGPSLNSGGLYKFQVKIVTADSYSNKLSEPIEYQVGISIPDTTNFKIDDPNFGEQELGVITYYDRIKNFRYVPETRAITFSMPFDWTIDNINQTSVVHEEIIIPKTFGDLMVSSVSAFVNGVELPENVITIDEFSEHSRILHLIIRQDYLLELTKTLKNNGEMNFLVKPSSPDLPLSTITGNGQYRITLNWEPHFIKSGAKTTFYFDITDVFLKNRPVSVEYELSIIHEGTKILSEDGISSELKGKQNVVEFLVPEHVSGPITLQFDNLGGNSLARVGIPVVVDRIITANQNGPDEILIPDWVKNNAGWWAEEKIQDSDFISGIEYLVKIGLIVISENNNSPQEGTEIPAWIRNNAKWWADGQITDNDFVKGIQYLVKNGIIRV